VLGHFVHLFDEPQLCNKHRRHSFRMLVSAVYNGQVFDVRFNCHGDSRFGLWVRILALVHPERTEERGEEAAYVGNEEHLERGNISSRLVCGGHEMVRGKALVTRC
jgi:hypothetical protein